MKTNEARGELSWLRFRAAVPHGDVTSGGKLRTRRLVEEIVPALTVVFRQNGCTCIGQGQGGSVSGGLLRRRKMGGAMRLTERALH